MEGNSTQIMQPGTGKQNTFSFDYSFYSHEKRADFATQEVVYNNIGKEMLDHAFEGYNVCIFAYGQTGAGKSYSMMGGSDDRGIIPRLCEELFDRTHKAAADMAFSVEVEMVEGGGCTHTHPTIHSSLSHTHNNLGELYGNLQRKSARSAQPQQPRQPQSSRAPSARAIR